VAVPSAPGLNDFLNLKVSFLLFPIFFAGMTRESTITYSYSLSDIKRKGQPRKDFLVRITQSPKPQRDATILSFHLQREMRSYARELKAIYKGRVATAEEKALFDAALASSVKTVLIAENLELLVSCLKLRHCYDFPCDTF